MTMTMMITLMDRFIAGPQLKTSSLKTIERKNFEKKKRKKRKDSSSVVLFIVLSHHHHHHHHNWYASKNCPKLFVFFSFLLL